MKTLIINTIIRSLAAVIIGGLIGSERARHGRAAGMIILKPNNVITGLTTAAGVWTTATIGIAVGYGYYIGALIVTVLFLATIILFAKFERHRKSAEVIYIELDNLYKVNATLEKLKKYIPEPFTYQIFAPKSNHSGNVGINLVIDKRIDLDISRLTEIENVVFAIEE